MSSRQAFLCRRYSQLHGATSLYNACPCIAVTLPPQKWTSRGAMSGSWLPEISTNCTPCSRHAWRSSSRKALPRSCQAHTRVSAVSPTSTSMLHPCVSLLVSSAIMGASQRSCPKWRSDTKRTMAPGGGSMCSMVANGLSVIACCVGARLHTGIHPLQPIR